MSLVARCGPVAILLSLFLGAAAYAQNAPRSSGSWTDPPVRGAAGPPAKPADAKPNGDRSAGPAAQAPSTPPAEPARTAAAPAAKPATARAAAAAVAKPAFRQPARIRRALAFRRPAVRPRAIVAARRPWRDRLRVAARREREARRVAGRRLAVVVRREAADTADRPRRQVVRTAVRRSYRDGGRAMLDAGLDAPPMQARRAGWGGLMGDDRAYRIAQARAAGYRVMRMRTYEYPDGSLVQRMTPYGPEDVD